MSGTRIFGIILLIAGAGLFGTSLYIQGRVEEGKVQVGRAETQVGQAEQAFKPIRPFARRVEKEFTGSAKERIAAANQDIAHYEQMAGYFRTGGIVTFAIGILAFLLGRIKKQK